MLWSYIVIPILDTYAELEMASTREGVLVFLLGIPLGVACGACIALLAGKLAFCKMPFCLLVYVAGCVVWLSVVLVVAYAREPIQPVDVEARPLIETDDVNVNDLMRVLVPDNEQKKLERMAADSMPENWKDYFGGEFGLALRRWLTVTLILSMLGAGKGHIFDIIKCNSPKYQSVEP